jgi:CDP-glucose 4,6-dehydratase
MGDLVRILNVFRGKRVFLTGDTGFKGSWLALWLAESGAEVYGYALPPLQENDHFKLIGIGNRIQHLDGDIRDRDKMSEFFHQAQPEFVFHLAAQALVRQSYRNPQETFETNVSGSVNLLECVRETPSVKALIYVTSDKCYRNREWIWGYRENDELGGHDPYSASKAAAEIVFSAYGNSFFKSRPDFGYASVRAGNVIGGGDWSEDRIVPDCMRALGKDKTIVLRKPQSTRPWQHVLEPLSGYLTLAAALGQEPQKFSGAWNFGPQGEATRSVKDLAQAIVARWGSGEIEIQGLADDPHEAGLLHLNCDKANHRLGWLPRWNFERTVTETVDWYRALLSGESVAKVSIKQLKLYMETAHD